MLAKVLKKINVPMALSEKSTLSASLSSISCLSDCESRFKNDVTALLSSADSALFELLEVQHAG